MPHPTHDLSQFDTLYSSMYHQRWPVLKAALKQPSTPIALSIENGKPYYLDEASVEAAKLLPVKPGFAVLDMCAAPGGKSLVLASQMQGTGSLVCNDRSSARRQRLHKVLAEHLSPSLHSIIRISSHDATKWGLYEQQVYDAILLDAPCSSEQHVLQNHKALKQWSASRTKRLAIQQFAMLAAALEAVKIGSHILYCTCSVSTVENEEVIAKLHAKRSGRFEEIPFDLEGAEPLEHGAIILPDKNRGKGPLYAALIRRLG
ncbi:MAG: RsmB/NOP family class I SAM-dependent RNA methyltransferase [Sphaerochaetaceae bacterium]